LEFNLIPSNLTKLERLLVSDLIYHTSSIQEEGKEKQMNNINFYMRYNARHLSHETLKLYEQVFISLSLFFRTSADRRSPRLQAVEQELEACRSPLRTGLNQTILLLLLLFKLTSSFLLIRK